MRTDSQRKKSSPGFTLVEIIVVLVILAILAVISIPALNGWIDQAHERRVVVACRACAVSAQGLITEAYAATPTKGPLLSNDTNLPLFQYSSGDGKTSFLSVPTDEAVRAIAGVKVGQTTGIKLREKSAVLEQLTYTDGDDNWATYVNQTGKDPYIMFSKGGKEWEKGIHFDRGEVMTTNGYIFACIAGHTTGSRSNTRNPTVKSNKGSWIVIGYTGEPLPYNSTVRYTVGMKVAYKGNYYLRTDYNLTGGQTPYSKSSSRYWILVGPVEQN